MSEADRLLDSVGGLARSVAERGDVADVLHDLAIRLQDVLDVASAAVSLVQDGEVRHSAAASEAGAVVERCQEARQVGPAVDVARGGQLVCVGDLSRAPEGWAPVVAEAATVGLRAVASMPMRFGEHLLGGASAYAAEPTDWSEELLHRGQVLTDVGTSLVWSAIELQRHRTLAEQLQRALDSRVLIEQAKGMIAARRGVSVDTAFKVLRRHANDHNATLRATAEAVVNLGLLL